MCSYVWLNDLVSCSVVVLLFVLLICVGVVVGCVLVNSCFVCVLVRLNFCISFDRNMVLSIGLCGCFFQCDDVLFCGLIIIFFIVLCVIEMLVLLFDVWFMSVWKWLCVFDEYVKLMIWLIVWWNQLFGMFVWFLVQLVVMMFVDGVLVFSEKLFFCQNFFRIGYSCLGVWLLMMSQW